MSKIQYILDTKTKELFKFSDILNDNSLTLKEFRIEWARHLKFKKPLYVCALCKQPLSLRSGVKDKKQLFLVHPKNSADCDWKSGRETSYEDALKMFHNIKESQEHKDLKAFIVNKLELDDSFSNVVAEKRVTNPLTETYKIPDVRATQTSLVNKIKVNKHIVFEIQLSTTFLDVILEREKFYFENKDNLIWIFAHHPKDLSKTKMTEDDILFTNKKNIFVLDDEARAKSIKESTLYLKNIHLVPIIDKYGEIDSTWSTDNLINISDIFFDPITGKSYNYNFEHERTLLLMKERFKNEIQKKQFLQIIAYMDKSVRESLHFGTLLRDTVFNSNTQEHLIDAFHKSQRIIGYILEIIYMDKNTKYLFDDSFNDSKTKDNRIVKMLHNALNLVMNSNKQYSDIIIKAIDYYGKSEYLIEINKKGTLISKIQNQRKYLMDDIPEHYQISLEYLFPELFYISYNPKNSY